MDFFNNLIDNFDKKPIENTNTDELYNDLITENQELSDKIDELSLDNKNLKEKNEELSNKIDTYTRKYNQVIYKEKGNYEIVKTDINNLKKFNIQNWNKNRPYCEVRVNEIINYYNEKNVKIIPGIIYIWYNNKQYNILDGLHRYTAATKLKRNIKVIVNINYSKNEQEIIDEFINLNKSIAIPSIYVDNDKIKKEVCEKVVNKLCINYPQFISPSRKHLVYNFNRDLLIEFVSTINIDFQIENIDKKIYKILMDLNQQAKQTVINGNLSYPKKCDKYNFYIFYLKKHFIKNEIEQKIKEF